MCRSIERLSGRHAALRSLPRSHGERRRCACRRAGRSGLVCTTGWWRASQAKSNASGAPSLVVMSRDSSTAWPGVISPAATAAVIGAIAQAASMRRSAICLRQINLLPRPKNSALPGRYIGRYSPQPQSHIERIEAERGPEGKLADPMLFRMAGAAQWDGVAVARLHPYTTIGSCTHMRGVRWRCFAAGDTGELTDKSQMLHPPTQVRLGLAARGAPGDARCGHRYQELPARSGSDAG